MQANKNEGNRICHGVVALLLCLTASLSAADWPTFGRNPQRSSSVAESSVSPANASAFELKWATQVENVPLALTSLTAPVVAENVATASGSKTLVFVAGSSDTFFALDAADGKVAWSRTFDSAVVPEDESYYLCPNAVNATPTIDTKNGTIYTIARDGKLYGLDVRTGATKFGPFQFVPAFAKAWSLNL
jgi:outer membrane protein assembly factor BamB